MPQTVERLQELLDLKDAQLEEKDATIERLEGKVDELEAAIRFDVDWMMQRRARESRFPQLPVPRIQMSVYPDEERNYQESEVALVIKHRDGTFATVPLGYGKTSGGKISIDAFPVAGALGAHLINDLPNSILSDTCHLSEQMGLPAFVILDEEHVYRITQMRPFLRIEVEQ